MLEAGCSCLPPELYGCLDRVVYVADGRCHFSESPIVSLLSNLHHVGDLEGAKRITIIVLMPFLCSGLSLLIICTMMSSHLVLSFHADGWSEAQPFRADECVHTANALVHCENKCTVDSRFRRQSWQKHPFGHPLLCRRSLHQSLFLMSSQVKKINLAGAQVAQISFLNDDFVKPRNWALYMLNWRSILLTPRVSK